MLLSFLGGAFLFALILTRSFARCRIILFTTLFQTGLLLRVDLALTLLWSLLVAVL